MDQSEPKEYYSEILHFNFDSYFSTSYLTFLESVRCEFSSRKASKSTFIYAYLHNGLGLHQPQLPSGFMGIKSSTLPHTVEKLVIVFLILIESWFDILGDFNLPTSFFCVFINGFDLSFQIVLLDIAGNSYVKGTQ